MCIGIPMQVIEPRGSQALCAGTGEPAEIDMALVGAQPAGAWVLTFLGAAREVITAERAGQIADALSALELALTGAGDGAAIDALFPDLANREPELPEFLKEKQRPVE